MPFRMTIVLLAVVLSLPAQATEAVYLDLVPSQSMMIAGKGPGQDAAPNPYSDGDSLAIVSNVGEGSLVARVQAEGKILKQVPVGPGRVEKIRLRAGDELYFDSRATTRVKIEFERVP